DGMQLREERIVHAAQEMRRDREKDAGGRNCEQQQQGQQVVGELLNRERATVTSAAEHRETDSYEDHHRGNVENVEDQRRQRAVDRKAEQRDAEDEGAIDLLSGSRTLESNPSKGERKGHGRR